MAFKLKEKLRNLKIELKSWNKKVFGDLDCRIGLVIEEIQGFDLLAESRTLALEEINSRSKAFATLWGLMRAKEINLVQRSRSRWLKEGDANTSFFHASIKSRDGSKTCLRCVRRLSNSLRNAPLSLGSIALR
ncbi:hypothetical protein TSUD_164960 [Trifolium subterraneum]|uniref:RNA-directed DNA polymerase (Reverse transcriptase) n=1 Tax=Trifolium subterraneum TaxID=3900 RepID=A0A2Z6N6L3_TRISU|nr:hypothetical protein TSUD_164960 [Trifolium subterraneum]